MTTTVTQQGTLKLREKYRLFQLGKPQPELPESLRLDAIAFAHRRANLNQVPYHVYSRGGIAFVRSYAEPAPDGGTLLAVIQPAHMED